ncbi:MAG: metal ABC transporter permease, partial [Clostridia bacterium]|nr:metal ABC transporter permease [Clostridia bacterium]
AVTVVLGMKMMGALLISSLIIFPALSSMRICRTFYKVIILSAVLSCLCFVAGLTIAFYLDLPTGATVVCVNIVVFLLCSLTGKILKR